MSRNNHIRFIFQLNQSNNDTEKSCFTLRLHIDNTWLTLTKACWCSKKMKSYVRQEFNKISMGYIFWQPMANKKKKKLTWKISVPWFNHQLLDYIWNRGSIWGRRPLKSDFMRKVWGKQNKGAALSLALIIVQAGKIVSTRQQKSPGKRKQTKSIAKNIYALFALEWIKQSAPN